MKKFISKSIVLIIVIVVVLLSITSCKNEPIDELGYDYSNLLFQSIDDVNTRIIDISLLGAHDMFSMDIQKDSKSNIYEDGIFNEPIVQKLAGDLIVAFSVAQNVNTNTLLKSGVRYIDLRLTLIDGIYYTCHGLISDKFEVYLIELIKFLSKTNGEYLIIDLQHFYTEFGQDRQLEDVHYQNLFDYIAKVKYDNKSILDFIYYDTNTKISDLTYNQITKNRSTSGVIFLVPNNSINIAYYRDTGAFYEYDGYQNIRSRWYNKFHLNSLIEEVDYEIEYILNNWELNKNLLRVCQYVRTPFSEDEIFKTLSEKSLINMSKSTNLSIIQDEKRFNNLIKAMPIILIDNVTLLDDDFLHSIISQISKYNKSISLSN